MKWFAKNNELKKQTRTMDHILFLFTTAANPEWVNKGFAELTQLPAEYQTIVLNRTETMLAGKQRQLEKKLPELRGYQEVFAEAAERRGSYDWDIDMKASLNWPLNDWRQAFKLNTWIAKGVSDRLGDSALPVTKLFAERASLYSIWDSQPGVGEEVNAMIGVATNVTISQAESERSTAIAQLKNVLQPGR